MCGIVCCYPSINFNLDKLNVVSDKYLHKRGPDKNFGANLNNVFLKHYKLEITSDSPISNQPITSNSKRYRLLFNGEIYNYKKFDDFDTSNGDTYLLSQLIDFFGVDKALEKIDGMFSIVIHDVLHNRLIVVRDHFGEKPLYYYSNNKFIILSSDARVISSMHSDNKIKKDYLFDIFRYGFNVNGESIFNKVYEVKPGEILTFNLDDLSLSKKGFYYKCNDNPSKGQNKFLSRINKRINDCSTNYFGIYLSGGLDSSYLSILAKKNNLNFKTYTIDYDGTHSEIVDRISKKYNFTNKIVTMSESDIKSQFDNLPIACDAPFCDISSLATLQLSKSASNDNIRVVITGDGADELFNGYKRYLAIKYKYIWNIYKLFFKNEIDIKNYYSLLSKSNEEKYYQIKSLIDLQVADINIYLRQCILYKSDRLNMFNSVESRAPYLFYPFYNDLIQSRSLSLVQKKEIKYELYKLSYPKLSLLTKRGFSPSYQYYNRILHDKYMFLNQKYSDFCEYMNFNEESEKFTWNKYCILNWIHTNEDIISF